MIRPMRGQVVVREIKEKASIWTPDPNPRQVRTHRGVVLALGPRATTPKTYDGDSWGGGSDVPYGFDVGDVVQYHFHNHNQAAYTMAWEDGEPATWMPQESVDGVWS
jgi:co-chaperonin GroES (HSP10)